MKNTPTRDTGTRIFATNQMVLKKNTHLLFFPKEDIIACKTETGPC